jgi:hypothetical protein
MSKIETGLLSSVGTKEGECRSITRPGSDMDDAALVAAVVVAAEGRSG